MSDLIQAVKDNIQAMKFPIKVVKASGFYDMIVSSTFDYSTYEKELIIRQFDNEDRFVGADQKPEATYLQLLAYYTLTNVIPEADSGGLPGGGTYCSHEYIDVGFHFSKFVCKHCNKDKE